MNLLNTFLNNKPYDMRNVYSKTYLAELILLQVEKINTLKDLLASIKRQNEHFVKQNNTFKNEIKLLKLRLKAARNKT
jgi:hypothetical protein